MKYLLILIIMLKAATTCFGQSYTYYGGFSPEESSFFRAPVGTEIRLSTTFNWDAEPPSGPAITPYFVVLFDTSGISITPAEGSSSANGSQVLNIVIKSDTIGCLNAAIGAYYDSMIEIAGFNIDGVFFSPQIIGRVTAPDSLTFTSPVPIDTKAEEFIKILSDSFGQYHRIAVISVNDPFSFEDTLQMMYPCESDYSYCSFQPTDPGHYVDTAKLLDELTNDTISVVLIGDAYDAGVSDVPAPQVILFPNPCDRELQIESISEESAQIEIYNLFGECVYRSTPQDNNAAIDCSDLPAGVYFVSIGGMASHLTQKLIVAH